MYPQTFAYDDLGNLTQRDSQTYTYTATKPHAVRRLGVDGTTDRFVYDAAGNMTRRGNQTLVYDAEGRLTTVKRGATNLETYAYDGDGVLVQKTSPTMAAQTLYTDTLQAIRGWEASWSPPNGRVEWNQPDPQVTEHATTLKLTGTGTDWTSTAKRMGSLSDGQTVRVAFRLSQISSLAALAIETRPPADYYRFGVFENGGTLFLQVYTPSLGYKTVGPLLSGLRTDRYYTLEFGANEATGLRASVWEENTSNPRYEMRYEMPMSQQWYFHAWMNSGTLWLDGSSQDGYLYTEQRPGASATNTRIIDKHFEYDYALNRQTKRYYADGRLLATKTGTTLTYVQGDHLGSTSTLTGIDRKVVAKERYSAFGERRRTSDTVLTDHR